MSYTKQEIEGMELCEICDVCEEYGLIQDYYSSDNFSEWLTDDGRDDADGIIACARTWDDNNSYDPSDYDVIVIDEDNDPYGYDRSDLYNKLIPYLEENDLLDKNGSNSDKEFVINVSKAQSLI